MIKQKKCKYCKELFTPFKSTIKNCNKTECIKSFLKENKEKINKATYKRKREQKTALKEELKSVRQVIKETKIPFQRYIRMRDEGLPCISCGRNTKDRDAGHYKKAELYSGVIFDEDNVHSQCRQCNRFIGGNEAEYRLGLVARYGEDFVLNLEEKARLTKSYKWTKEELAEIKKEYLNKIREFKK